MYKESAKLYKNVQPIISSKDFSLFKINILEEPGHGMSDRLRATNYVVAKMQKARLNLDVVSGMPGQRKNIYFTNKWISAYCF